jgi:hypothetical protein
MTMEKLGCVGSKSVKKRAQSIIRGSLRGALRDRQIRHSAEAARASVHIGCPSNYRI